MGRRPPLWMATFLSWGWGWRTMWKRKSLVYRHSTLVLRVEMLCCTRFSHHNVLKFLKWLGKIIYCSFLVVQSILSQQGHGSQHSHFSQSFLHSKMLFKVCAFHLRIIYLCCPIPTLCFDVGSLLLSTLLVKSMTKYYIVVYTVSKFLAII